MQNEKAKAAKTDALSISMDSEKLKYAGREDIKINITLKNEGKDKVSFQMEDAERFFHIEVIDPDSKKAPLLSSYRSRRITGGEGYSLSDNQTKTVTLWISRVFDMSQVGTYNIVVSKDFLMDDGKSKIVKSNELNIEVNSLLPTSQWH